MNMKKPAENPPKGLDFLMKLKFNSPIPNLMKEYSYSTDDVFSYVQVRVPNGSTTYEFTYPKWNITVEDDAETGNSLVTFAGTGPSVLAKDTATLDRVGCRETPETDEKIISEAITSAKNININIGTDVDEDEVDITDWLSVNSCPVLILGKDFAGLKLELLTYADSSELVIGG